MLMSIAAVFSLVLGIYNPRNHAPGGDIAMLRWVRPFAELPTDALEA